MKPYFSPALFKPAQKMVAEDLKIPAIFWKRFDLQKKSRIENHFIFFEGFKSFTLTAVRSIQFTPFFNKN